MTNYYRAALIGHRLSPLTYESDREIAIGCEVTVPLASKTKTAIILERAEQPPFECRRIVEASDRMLKKAYLDTALFIAEYYGCEAGEALALFSPARETRLETISVSTNIALSPLQEEALLFAAQNRASLLFGDTGSGKSEIYMKLFERVLNENKTALFLMPEIGLTPQMEKRLRVHFGDLIAIWHSKVTAAKKRATLERIERGEIRIVAGARSALFLPMPGLGAIVIDEEHDESYKSQNRPRWNARDMAALLGKTLSIPVVLGSATPSVATYAKFPMFRLRGQFFSEASRGISFVSGALDEPCEAVIEALRETLARKKQAIVFLPTRANFKYLICEHCGGTLTCPFCAVGMSLHTQKKALVCHYCNTHIPLPKRCPACGGGMLRAERHGTAEIAELLRAVLPEASIALFDRDAIKTDSKLRVVLKRFNDGEIDILVGTQMLSKGHDYHGVELSVALGIDHVLAQNDYRARERAISLLVQLAGRAGRRSKARIIVQTRRKGGFEPFWEDYEKFIRDETEKRKALFPPHVKLLRLVISAADQAEAKRKHEEALERLAGAKDVEVIGGGECAIGRLKNRYRYQINLRSRSAKALIAAAKAVPQMEADMDPIRFD
ncbi:MAG: primosomal protein N' [Helicobacteraceae bacterium]|nr:primosomal protein N' [Helicobacteraceae bacterium]